jgi:hypothetical protein
MNIYLSNVPNAINMWYFGIHDEIQEVGTRGDETAHRRRVSICTFVLVKQFFFPST